MAVNPCASSTRPSLLLRIRDANDATSWQTFVDIYGPLIYRHCRNRGLQDADAAEVMQEVLLQVSRCIARFDYRPDQGRFRDWLRTVTHNKLASFCKKKARSIQANGQTGKAEQLDSVLSSEQDTAWNEAFNGYILQTALVRVRPRFEEPTWRAFELTWLDDYSATEAARTLDRELDWVYVAKSRVLKRLHEEIHHLTEDTPLRQETSRERLPVM